MMGLWGISRLLLLLLSSSLLRIIPHARPVLLLWAIIFFSVLFFHFLKHIHRNVLSWTSSSSPFPRGRFVPHPIEKSTHTCYSYNSPTYLWWIAAIRVSVTVSFKREWRKKKLVYTRTRIALIPFEKWLIENGFLFETAFINVLFLFCFIQAPALAKKCIVHYTTEDQQKRANAALLIGSYAVSWPAFFLFFLIRFLSDCVQWWPSREVVRSPTQLRSVKKDWRTLPFSFFLSVSFASWMNNVACPWAVFDRSRNF